MARLILLWHALLALLSLVPGGHGGLRIAPRALTPAPDPKCAATTEYCADGSENMTIRTPCCNKTEQCVAQDSTAAWCVAKPHLAANRSRYSVLWNSPWPSECEQHEGGGGGPIDWTAVGVEVNAEAAFNGEVVVDLYRTGIFPSFFGNGTAVNGGLPQSPKFSLSLHLAALSIVINEDVPSTDFRGVGVLDFETWYPQWNWHGPPHLPVGDIYWNESIKLAAATNPSLKGAALLAAAKAAWLEGAQDVMVATIDHAKKMRPNGVWGYYDAMLPPDDCVTTVSGGGAVRAQGMENPCSVGNDDLPRLWEAVDAIMPSIYLSTNASSNQGGIDSKVGEAARLATGVATRRADSAAPLVLPFACAMYGHWQEEGVPAWTHWLDTADAMSDFARPAEWGAAGVVAWASSTATYRKKTCTAGRVAFDNVLSPVLKDLAMKTSICAKEKCNGHGRCATLPKVACICDVGWAGISCQTQHGRPLKTEDAAQRAGPGMALLAAVTCTLLPLARGLASAPTLLWASQPTFANETVLLWGPAARRCRWSPAAAQLAPRRRPPWPRRPSMGRTRR
jgi:hyaluronoglucosaminidase